MKQFKGLPINPIIQTEFQEYIRNGEFPKSLDYPNLPSRAIYTKGIIAEIFKKDIQANRKSNIHLYSLACVESRVRRLRTEARLPQT